MKLNKGLFTDTRLEDQPAGTYRHAKNIVLNNNLGALENELGFTAEGITIPYKVIGVLPVDECYVVFSTDNTNSEIGLVDGGAYTTVYNSTELNFNQANPVQAEAYKNFKEERNVAFIDGLNVPRIINVDNPSVNDINDLRIFPFSNVPVLDVSVLDTGGSTESGTYQFAARYKNFDGSVTNFFYLSKPLSITDDSSSGAFEDYDGALAGTTTGKSVNIAISNQDTNYDFIEIAVVRQNDGVTTAQLIKKLPVSTTNTVYVGTESLEDLTNDNVLVNGASFINAKAIGQLNNRLYLANLTSDDLIEYQEFANDIEITYTSTIKDILTVPQKSTQDKGFRHGEVYAFYIAFILSDGSYSQAFHIPGRTVQPSDITASTIAAGEGITAKVYQVEDTSSGTTGEMGYWENEDEEYPSVGNYPTTGSSGSGARVRHHKFPSISKIKNLFHATNDNYGKTQLDELSINVNNVVIPPSISGKVQGWQIFYAQRNVSDSIIVGQSLFQFAGQAEGTTNITTTSGNYRLDNMSFTVNSQINPLTTHMRFSAFDLLVDKPSFSPSFIANELTINTDTFDPALNTSNENQRYALFDFTNPDVTYSETASTSYLRSVSLAPLLYLPNNVVTGNIDNRDGDEAVLLEVNNGNTLDITVDINDGRGFGPIDNFSNVRERTYLTNLCQLLRNSFIDFANRTIVATDVVNTSLTSSLTGVKGGDVNLCAYSYMATAMRAKDVPSSNEVQSATKAIKYFICESVNNVNLRHEILTASNGRYYPKSDITGFVSPGSLHYEYDTDSVLNIGYNKDYTKLNNSKIPTVFDPFSDFTTNFPFTVISSSAFSTEGDEVSWRSFLSNDRYVMPRDKGVITNLQGVGNDKLLIHHEKSLFITRDVAKLTTEIGDVTLGSGDLFRIPPQEVVPTKEGYAGTQHAFSCLLTKDGYFFVDDEQGKIFLYNNAALEEISSKGKRIFFRDNLGVTNDNPFNDDGYSVAFDEDYNRIVLTKNFGSESFTASYSPLTKSWISFHDYIPNFIFRTRNNLYSIKSTLTTSTVYLHNVGARGVYYDEGVINPFFVDVIYNEAPYQTKIFKSLDWVNQSFNEDVLVPKDSFDFITLRSKDKCSGRIPLVQSTNPYNPYGTNLRKEETNWSFNDFRDIAISEDLTENFYADFNLKLNSLKTTLEYYNKSRFIDKFVLSRYEYSNSNNYTFYFMESRINYTNSVR